MRIKNGRPRHQAAQGRSWLMSARVFAVLTVLAISVVGAEVAVAAAPLAATTSPASSVTSTSATLNGIVSPNKTAPTYYFQYGTTMGYGTKTPSQGPLNGNAGKAVSANVTGLTPSTTYHFQVVATNSAGETSKGSDATFTTTASGTASKNTVSIKATPHSVTFGRATTIAGQVTGPNSAGIKVTLEANPYPYTSGFKPTSLSTTTSTTGSYSLPVTPSVNTRYEVTAKTKPPVASAPVAVNVRVKVTLRVSTLRPASGQLVRFSGTVTPAHNGKFAQIQKRTSTGTWKTVASTRLLAAAPVNGVAISRFSKRLRISRTATYRVLVNPRDGDHITGTSRTRAERVH